MLVWLMCVSLLPWLFWLPILPVSMWLMCLTLLPRLTRLPSVPLFFCYCSDVTRRKCFPLRTFLARSPHSSLVLNSSDLTWMLATNFPFDWVLEWRTNVLSRKQHCSKVHRERGIWGKGEEFKYNWKAGKGDKARVDEESVRVRRMRREVQCFWLKPHSLISWGAGRT
jgi:hypothetical protein